MPTKTYLIAAALLALSLTGCDDNNARSGCRSSDDCRGLRVCVEGACAEPDSDAGRDTGDRDTDSPDATRDVPSPRDTRPADTTPPPDVTDPPDMPPPDLGDPDICRNAFDYVAECGYPPPETLGYGIDWDVCDEFSACGAQCVLDMTCGGLECDFNPDIDCDSAPLWDCLQENCQEPEVECRGQEDCNQVYDCCAEAWVCFPDGEGVTCDRDCQRPSDPPGCECADGLCRVSPPDPDEGNICTQADRRFTECGYDVGELRERFPREVEIIEHYREGLCEPLDACMAACIVHERDDQCMQCHFGAQLCVRDPFEECFARCNNDPEPALCIQSGGQWGDSDCENCCGPAGCGADPFEGCPEPCCGPPQCYCPLDAPFWAADQGCFARNACFPDNGRACTSRDGVCADGDCPPNRVDADSPLGCDTGRCCLPLD
jgi:hypothetical protein